jgi:hypothetical protein
MTGFLSLDLLCAHTAPRDRWPDRGRADASGRAKGVRSDGFLLILLNDRELIGEHVSSPLRSAPSIGAIVLLIVCNGLYGISTMFPNAL